MKILERVVQDADDGRKVKYYARGVMGVSYHQFAALKMREGLRVNGLPVHANHLLHAGDVVTVLLEDAPREAIVPDPTPVNVVYGDEDMLIIDKPAPLATQCSPKQDAMTLENRLAYRYRNDASFVFRPLNRLDRGTSGLMAAAKNAHAAQILQKQLHTDAFVREYLAVVEGHLTGAGTIDAPIAKEAAATVRRVIDYQNGVRAVTHYYTILSGDRFSLVRLRLETGRTHQIRVHLAHIGHPIVGDFLYGTEEPRLPQRFALHSTYIRLNHPLTGQTIERHLPLPKALTALLMPIGGTVTVTIDRPLGSVHPDYPDMFYPVNYGFIEGILASDGEWQDAYVLGVDVPVESFTGRVVAVIHRLNDVEDKWVVCPDGMRFEPEAIQRQVFFQERYYDSEIITD